jgi:Ca-activated chloride channel family protein
MSHDVFISHSSIDKTIADAVTAALEQSQIRCWIAPRDILPGESWGGSIVDAIEASKVMVMVFSSNSNDSKQVMREIERAVQKDVVVVPFRVEAVEPSRDMEYFLSATHWLDAITPEMDDHLKDLVGTVQALLSKSKGDKTSGATPKPAATAKPATKMPSSTTIGNKKGGGLKWLAIPALLLLLAAAGWLFMGGDGEESQTAASGSGGKGGDQILAKDLGEREAGSIKLKLPDSVEAAQTLTVGWSGESASNDRILFSKSDSEDGVSLAYSNTGESKQADLPVPGVPGEYEIRYQDGSNRQIIARETIEVTKPEVTLTADTEQAPGGEVRVAWKAPNNKSDYLAIAKAGVDDGSYVTYSYTSKGSPTSIRVPDVPGDYELRYVSSRDKAVWASQDIKVLEPELEFTLPATASAGASVTIDWKGPGNKGDYFCVSRVDAEPGQYLHYVYARSGKKAQLKMPEEAGEFEVRYISGLSKQIWGTQAVTVEMPEVSLQAPSTAIAGHEIDLVWVGPANKSDYLSVAELGSEGGKYLSYQYARKNNTKARMVMPDTPGTYALRYISGGDKNIWAQTEIEVTPRSVELSVPETVTAGEKFGVSWKQKGFQREYVAIYKVGAPVKSYENYANAKNRTDTALKAPVEPGEYEVRYISGNENLVWATSTVTVE